MVRIMEKIKYLTISEAAKFVKCSTMTIHRRKMDGKLKAHKMGRFFFYLKKDLLKLKNVTCQGRKI